MYLLLLSLGVALGAFCGAEDNRVIYLLEFGPGTRLNPKHVRESLYEHRRDLVENCSVNEEGKIVELPNVTDIFPEYSVTTVADYASLPTDTKSGQAFAISYTGHITQGKDARAVVIVDVYNAKSRDFKKAFEWRGMAKNQVLRRGRSMRDQTRMNRKDSNGSSVDEFPRLPRRASQKRKESQAKRNKGRQTSSVSGDFKPFRSASMKVRGESQIWEKGSHASFLKTRPVAAKRRSTISPVGKAHPSGTETREDLYIFAEGDDASKLPEAQEVVDELKTHQMRILSEVKVSPEGRILGMPRITDLFKEKYSIKKIWSPPVPPGTPSGMAFMIRATVVASVDKSDTNNPKVNVVILTYDAERDEFVEDFVVSKSERPKWKVDLQPKMHRPVNDSWDNDLKQTRRQIYRFPDPKSRPSAEVVLKILDDNMEDLISKSGVDCRGIPLRIADATRLFPHDEIEKVNEVPPGTASGQAFRLSLSGLAGSPPMTLIHVELYDAVTNNFNLELLHGSVAPLKWLHCKSSRDLDPNEEGELHGSFKAKNQKKLMETIGEDGREGTNDPKPVRHRRKFHGRVSASFRDQLKGIQAPKAPKQSVEATYIFTDRQQMPENVKKELLNLLHDLKRVVEVSDAGALGDIPDVTDWLGYPVKKLTSSEGVPGKTKANEAFRILINAIAIRGKRPAYARLSVFLYNGTKFIWAFSDDATAGDLSQEPPAPPLDGTDKFQIPDDLRESIKRRGAAESQSSKLNVPSAASEDHNPDWQKPIKRRGAKSSRRQSSKRSTGDPLALAVDRYVFVDHGTSEDRLKAISEIMDNRETLVENLKMQNGLVVETPDAAKVFPKLGVQRMADPKFLKGTDTGGAFQIEWLPSGSPAQLDVQVSVWDGQSDSFVTPESVGV